MSFEGKKIGFCITGSFCTLKSIIPQIQKLHALGADIYPIFSYAVATMDTRFTSAAQFRREVEDITGHSVIDTIVDAEPIGPKRLLDLVLIAPCTGNTLAKLVHGITDTPVLMAAKAHLRNSRPLLLAISTNDGLGNNGRNLGTILNTKNVYLVPFYQDGPDVKANSLVADVTLIPDAAVAAITGKQIQPVIILKKGI